MAIKSFKEYTKNKKKKHDDDEDGIAPDAIHFKFTHDNEDVVAPDVIHFKFPHHKKGKHLEEAKAAKIKWHDHWLSKNENTHLGKTSAAISKKLSKGSKFSDQHHDHLDRYTADSGTINRHLLKTKGKPSLKHAVHAKHIDAAIDANRIKHDVHVYSGTTFDPRKHIGKNKVMKSHAYISTTHNKYIADGFSANKAKGINRHIVHIHLKAGDPAAHISHVSKYPGEHETIIKRGTRLKHISTEKTDDGGIVHIHHMEVAR